MPKQIPDSGIRAPEDKKDKDSINYRHREHCSLCAGFLPPHRCIDVEGHIAGDAVCDLYRFKEPPKVLTKEDFERLHREERGE